MTRAAISAVKQSLGDSAFLQSWLLAADTALQVVIKVCIILFFTFGSMKNKMKGRHLWNLQVGDPGK